MTGELECCVPTLQWNEAGIKTSSRVSETFDGLDLTTEETHLVNKAVASAEGLPGNHMLQHELESVDDVDTLEHSARVAKLAASIVIRAGGSSEAALHAATTGFAHDVWKKFLQDVVHVPRRLSDEEMQRVRRHPLGGAQMVAFVDLPVIVEVGVGNHHGYGRNPYPAFPDRLWTPTQGDDELSDEHLVSMAVAAADAFDASRSPRPERLKPRSYEESVAWVNDLQISDTIKRTFVSMFQQHVELAA